MVHQYQLGGYNLVLDTCSGAIHAVDEIAYDIISLFETTEREELVQKISEKYDGTAGISREEVEECYDQVVSLRDSGRLLPPIHLKK